MARSGQSSQRRQPRHNVQARSQCSDSNPSPAISNTPVSHRRIPGASSLPGAGILPIPVVGQRLEVAPAFSHGAQLSGHLPVDVPAQVITIPSHLIQASHKKLFGNKVVLAFETEFNSRRTLNWLAAFNQKSPISLTLGDVLIISLFVVQFDAALGSETRDTLLQSSPLKALDCFAAVNPYGPEFDPSRVPDFRHLTTIHISRGSPLIFEYLQFVVSPIGRLIRSNLAPGSESHRITAVVETSLKSFPQLVRIYIPPTGTISIPFDFSNKNVRCLICLSYSHANSRCPIHPSPSILGIPPPPPPPVHGIPISSSQSHPALANPLSSSSVNLLELQARIEKDRLEIQYWQSLALSLKKKGSTSKKPSTKLHSSAKRKRQSLTAHPEAAPASSSALPAPAPPPSTNLVNQPSVSQPKQFPTSSRNRTDLPAVPTSSTQHPNGIPSCSEPSHIPSSLLIPPCPPTGESADCEIGLLNPSNSEHVTLRKRSKRLASSSGTETDPETTAHLGGLPRASSPCHSLSAVRGGHSAKSHGPIYDPHIQREGAGITPEKTPGETISGKSTPKARHSLFAGTQTERRKTSSTRMGDLARGKVVCGSGL